MHNEKYAIYRYLEKKRKGKENAVKFKSG